MAGYVPERGDIVWLDFSPQAGHEQAGNGSVKNSVSFEMRHPR